MWGHKWGGESRVHEGRGSGWGGRKEVKEIWRANFTPFIADFLFKTLTVYKDHWPWSHTCRSGRPGYRGDDRPRHKKELESPGLCNVEEKVASGQWALSVNIGRESNMKKTDYSWSVKPELERHIEKYSHNTLRVSTVKGGRNGLLSFVEHLLWARVWVRLRVCVWSQSRHCVSESVYDEGTECQNDYGTSLRPQSEGRTKEELVFELLPLHTDPMMVSDHATSVWPHTGEIDEGCLHGPRLTPAVLWRPFQFWSSVHSPRGLKKYGWSAEGWRDEPGGMICGQVIWWAEWREWQRPPLGLIPSNCTQQ